MCRMYSFSKTESKIMYDRCGIMHGRRRMMNDSLRMIQHRLRKMHDRRYLTSLFLTTTTISPDP